MNIHDILEDNINLDHLNIEDRVELLKQQEFHSFPIHTKDTDDEVIASLIEELNKNQKMDLATATKYDMALGVTEITLGLN